MVITIVLVAVGVVILGLFGLSKGFRVKNVPFAKKYGPPPLDD